MKIGIITDTHAKEDRIPELKIVLDEIYSNLSDCDILVHIGDVSEASPAGLALMSEFFTKWERVIVVAGNHDLAPTPRDPLLTWCDMLESLSNVTLVKGKAVVIDDMLFTPYPQFAPYEIIPTGKRSDDVALLRAAMMKLWAEYEGYNYHFAHIGVMDATLKRHIVDKKDSMRDVIFSADELPDVPSLFGHYHQPQKLKQIRFIGSTLRLTAADEGLERYIAKISEAGKIRQIKLQTPTEMIGVELPMEDMSTLKSGALFNVTIKGEAQSQLRELRSIGKIHSIKPAPKAKSKPNTKSVEFNAEVCAKAILGKTDVEKEIVTLNHYLEESQ